MTAITAITVIIRLLLLSRRPASTNLLSVVADGNFFVFGRRQLLSLLGLCLLGQDSIKSLFLLLSFLLLLYFILHLHELLYLHALFDLFLAHPLLFGLSLLLQPFSFLRSQLVLLKPGIGEIVLLLTVSDPLTLLSVPLMSL